MIPQIIVVDDDPMILKKAWNTLDEAGMKAVVFKSGKQLIDYMNEGHTADLILMDYDMPITTGSMVMEMIRSEPESADIPVIFLTGKSDKETVMQVMSLKPQGYLIKTMDKDKIIAAIDKFFENSKWQNAINASEIKEKAPEE